LEIKYLLGGPRESKYRPVKILDFTSSFIDDEFKAVSSVLLKEMR
jgi:hypothetical protein